MIRHISERPGNRAEHPLLINRLVLPTAEFEQAIDIVIQAFNDGATGCAVWGDPGLGKTWIEKFFRDPPPNLLNFNYTLFSIDAMEYDKVSDAQFFADILHQLKHPEAASGEKQSKTQRLINMVVKATKQSPQPAIAIVCIDEAQNLSIHEFKLLKSFMNRVVKAGVDIRFILIGEPGLRSRLGELRQHNMSSITGRFFTRRHEYGTVNSSAKLANNLALFDDQKVFPQVADPAAQDQRVSCTEYFSPVGYQDGFRLRDKTGLIWKTLKDVLSAQEIPTKRMFVPMRFTTRFARHILLAAEERELAGKRYEFDQEKFYDFVVQSGFAEYISDNEPVVNNEN